MNLVLDLGNTAAKVALFSDGELERLEIYEKDQLSVGVILKDFPETKVKAAILSSVVNHSQELEQFVQTFSTGIVLNAETPLPITNEYETPATLGKDRLANAAGLAFCFPKENALCVDIGTCVKFDRITKEGVYSGGAISPGFQMRYKALNTFTDKLPLIELQTIDHLIGTNSEDSIVSGVYNGLLKEIDGVIDAYREQHENLKVVLTGGDVSFFENALKNTIFADAFLTLKGLNAILDHNVE